MGRPNRDHRLTFIQNFSCGGIAGITSRTLTSPLDVVKIVSQVGTNDSRQGFLRTFINLYQKQGLRAFWKGNLLGCLRLFPFSAVQITSFNFFRVQFQDEYGRCSGSYALLAGTLGGAVATIVTYPTDMIKTRLIVQHTNTPRYRGIVHAFKLVLQEEGLLAFYRGLFASLVGTVPFACVYYMTYEILQEMVWRKPRFMLSPTENFFNGCLAAAVAQTASYPFDTIRKKLQAQSKVLPGNGGCDVRFHSLTMGFRVIIDRHGIVGLWRGLTANLLKVVPYHGLMFATFEALRRFYLYENGYTRSALDDSPKPGTDQSLKPGQLKQYMSRMHGND